MSDWRKEWFTFDRRDRIAIPFLFLIVVALVLSFALMDEWYKGQFDVSTSELLITDSSQTKKDYLDRDSVKEKDSYSKSYTKKESWNQGQKEIQYFQFNPNTISVDSFAMLGFSQKEAKAFVNFRESGFVIKSPEQITKSFVVTKEDFKRLEPYIELLQTENQEKSNHTEEVKTEKSITIEVNSASETDFQQLYGIGPTFAKRIVNFRESLGGFYKIQQLNEVYGLEDSTYHQIQSHLTINLDQLRKININKANITTFKNHPYISYSIANALVKYRKQHGRYKTKDEIKNVHLISNEKYSVLSHYITVK